jgi:hypothetical protein
MPVPVDIQAAGDAALDAWLSHHIHETEMQGKPFLPLPVLGVPAWWSANEEMGFYEDPQVFRPQKKQGY